MRPLFEFVRHEIRLISSATHRPTGARNSPTAAVVRGNRGYATRTLGQNRDLRVKKCIYLWSKSFQRNTKFWSLSFQMNILIQKLPDEYIWFKSFQMKIFDSKASRWIYSIEKLPQSYISYKTFKRTIFHPKSFNENIFHPIASKKNISDPKASKGIYLIQKLQ